MPSGRKSIKEEIGVLQRYNELSNAYFEANRGQACVFAILNPQFPKDVA